MIENYIINFELILSWAYLYRLWPSKIRTTTRFGMGKMTLHSFNYTQMHIFSVHMFTIIIVATALLTVFGRFPYIDAPRDVWKTHPSRVTYIDASSCVPTYGTRRGRGGRGDQLNPFKIRERRRSPPHWNLYKTVIHNLRITACPLNSSKIK